MYLTSESSNNQGNDHDVELLNEEIVILSNEDERLKLIGEILSNESSRGILKILVSNEFTAYKIVKKTDLSLSLVLHHINKMRTAGIVNISKISQTSRNQEMKHYTAKQGIMILPQTVSEKAKSSKTFQNSLKRIMRFSSIAVAGIASWFITQASLVGHPRPALPPYGDFLPSQIFWSAIMSLVVVIIGLVAERIFVSIKNNCLSEN